MATSKIQVTEGSGKNVATNSFSEDAVTKEAQRVVINNSSGVEVSSWPITVADAGDVTLGAKADARSTATDTTPITAMQVLKEISYMAQNPATVTVQGTVTGNVAGTVTTNKGDTNYTKFTKVASLTSTGETDVWAPNTGKKFVVTDIMTSAAAAGNITFRDGTAGTAILTDYYAANGGRTSNLQTPMQSATANSHLTVQASATAMSVTVTGYEV